MERSPRTQSEAIRGTHNQERMGARDLISVHSGSSSVSGRKTLFRSNKARCRNTLSAASKVATGLCEEAGGASLATNRRDSGSVRITLAES